MVFSINCCSGVVPGNFRINGQLIVLNGGAIPAPSPITADWSIAAFAAQPGTARTATFAIGGLPVFTAMRANGTAAAPTTLALNDLFASFSGGGYDGTAYANAQGALRFFAAQGWGVGAHGSSAEILTTPVGSTTLTRAVLFGSDQTATFSVSCITPALTVGGGINPGIPAYFGTISQVQFIGNADVGVMTLGKGVQGAGNRWMRMGWDSTNNRFVFNDYESGADRGRISGSGSLDWLAPITTMGYTVATLPAGSVGMIAHVTDALAPAYGVAVVGGGAVRTQVFHTGAAWVAS